MEKEMLAPNMLQRVVSPDQWTEEHRQFLKEEKELTRLYDKILAGRQKLPWSKVEKAYVFDGPDGQVSLSDLFEGRSQLVIQHFMFGPDDEEGCIGCSFSADHVDSARIHFEQNDLSFAAVSRGTIEKLQQYKKRMGWSFNWVSSLGNDFNYVYHVSFTKDDLAQGKVYYNFEMTEVHGQEQPGISVFYKDENGDIYHTYSSYGRGTEQLLGAYNYLDLAPKGRNENGPNRNLMDWVRRHDTYAQSSSAADCCCTPSNVKS